jgi:hypothetical protein
MKVAYQSAVPDEQRQAAASAVGELLDSVRVAVTREEIGRQSSVGVSLASGADSEGNGAGKRPTSRHSRQAPRLRNKRRLVDRWRGTSVEWAYAHLHAAKTVLVELLPMEEVDAQIPSAIARLATGLDSSDVRRLNLEQLQDETNEARRRAGLKQALDIGYDASDQLHSRARDFRNMLLVATGVISALMLIIVAAVALAPWAMPLCFEPTVPSPAATRSESGTDSVRKVCPSGEDTKEGDIETLRDPTAGDVIIVAVLGLLGGALAGAFAIRKVSGTSTPYDVPLALAVLKLPIGSLTAVTGILLLGGGFVPGFSELDSQRQILAYALLLGYAQQLATQFIDKRAETILHSIPAKDASSNQPTQPAASVNPLARHGSPRAIDRKVSSEDVSHSPPSP